MNLFDAVGDTPLLPLEKISRAVGGAQIFAKAEFFNPSGSVKDRAAKAMLADGLATGKLGPGKELIDATSGNTGIAYAMFGAALGVPVKIYMPANASAERQKIIRVYRAEIVATDPLESSDGAYYAARRAYDAAPEKYFYPDQYHNDANWRAHYETTAPEIWRQTAGKITHFVALTGTSGTFTGVSRRLKEFNPAIKVFAAQPDSPMHGLEGTKHLASTLKPGFFDANLPDGYPLVETESAYKMARRLAREEGLFVGISSGGNLCAAAAIAANLPREAVVVTILADGGGRYLSDKFWDQ
ncbi:cysteine synthase [Planctomycetales bacterium]|nr:cysteine synthase [Planctomycetales bacterium]